MPENTTTPSDADRLATQIREALDKVGAANYQRGRYSTGADADWREPQREADAATVALWRTFYDVASKLGVAGPFVVEDADTGRPIGPFSDAESAQAWISQATDTTAIGYASPDDLRVEELLTPDAALAGIRGVRML